MDNTKVSTGPQRSACNGGFCDRWLPRSESFDELSCLSQRGQVLIGLTSDVEGAEQRIALRLYDRSEQNQHYDRVS